MELGEAEAVFGGKIALCLLFALYNNFTDWQSWRISNQAVMLFVMLGLGVNTLCLGWQGLLLALAGGSVMLVLLPLFALRMLGAGDIKELLAIGCMLGWPTAPAVLLYSLLAAGILALAVLLLRRNFDQRRHYLLSYFKSCWLLGRPLPYNARLDNKEAAGFRFSFGVTGGLVLLSLRVLAGL